MFKKLSFLFIALLGLTALNAQQALSADEILAKYFEGTGGLAKWKSLSSLKMEGVMAMGPMEFPGTIYQKAPNKQRIVVNIQGQTLVQAYDGVKAWWINPFMGGTDPQPMPDEMAEDMTKQTFESEFIDYAAKGHQVEYTGVEEVEGAKCNVLKLTKKNGDVEFHYFDQEYNVPIMVKTTISSGDAKGQFVETYVSDYQEVEGVMMPHFIETKFNGQTQQKITIKSIVVNEEMADDLFSFPAGK